MTLDEAAKYLAERYISEPYPYQIKYWKSRLVFAYMRGHITETPTLEEIENWLENNVNRQRVTIRFDKDLHEKLQQRFGGKYGEMSDFVNRAVREAL